ncbi:DUF4256 domain-containing protein [Flavobacterium alvei]|uniref:DUF4256 domain-containing protein n=1 Tax=Flavobacterium alvei TaxID=2080416 RepID=A0A2S5AAT3_9FLAO|nr:DUF4256 domain-containing protein [Flavobacterium alvei]
MMRILPDDQISELINILKLRFEKNQHRHKDINWINVETKLATKPERLWSLHQMEITDGEPDIIGYDKNEDVYLFCDCSAESPKGRRSLCYDDEALNSRKENKPINSVLTLAENMGIELLNEEQYKKLQELENFDQKTSSWIRTPNDLRKLGGALFGDFRFGRVFVYHNGAESYYAARGFRGIVKV